MGVKGKRRGCGFQTSLDTPIASAEQMYCVRHMCVLYSTYTDCIEMHVYTLGEWFVESCTPNEALLSFYNYIKYDVTLQHTVME